MKRFSGAELFRLDGLIRCVSIMRKGKTIERIRRSESECRDRPMEECVGGDPLQPTILELERRGDYSDIRYLAVRYRSQIRLLFPHSDGHVSVGVDLSGDIPRIVRKIQQVLNGGGVGEASGAKQTGPIRLPV